MLGLGSGACKLMASVWGCVIVIVWIASTSKLLKTAPSLILSTGYWPLFQSLRNPHYILKAVLPASTVCALRKEMRGLAGSSSLGLSSPNQHETGLSDEQNLNFVRRTFEGNSFSLKHFELKPSIFFPPYPRPPKHAEHLNLTQDRLSVRIVRGVSSSRQTLSV